MNHENEVHQTFTQNGHIMSVDCWCEPVVIETRVNKYGVEYLCVVHNDEHALFYIRTGEPVQRLEHLALRTEHSRDPWNGNHHEAPWITRALDRVGLRPMLPPHMEH